MADIGFCGYMYVTENWTIRKRETEMVTAAVLENGTEIPRSEGATAVRSYVRTAYTMRFSFTILNSKLGMII